MFWGDRIVADIQSKFGEKIKSGRPLVIRDEKTASGRVHVGSMRGVAIHGIVDEILKEKNIPHTFLYEINDYDPMDGLPVYLDQDVYKEHMGKPLCNVPSPDGKAKNYAEYFAEEFMGVIKETGFAPTYYRSSELYKGGKMNEPIRLALEKAHIVRKIYKDISGSVRADDWLPLSVICEKCGKVGTTKARDFDGKTVEYTCGKFVDWADGCGHNARVAPFDGRAKLPWKVEWPAKFLVMGVDIEGGGKDHSTKGGAREIADAIAKEVFGINPPMNLPYEFFQVGGKKMSSSKGAGSSSREVADLLPPELFRTLLIQKEPLRTIEFEPNGDTIPTLYDFFDTYAKAYFEKSTEPAKVDQARIFYLAKLPSHRENIALLHLPRFSLVAFLAQMPHLDPVSEIEKMEEIALDEASKAELKLRIEYAKRWLKDYAPAEYRYEIQAEVPEGAKDLNETQKNALRQLLHYIESMDPIAWKVEGSGQAMHTKLHEIKTATAINPKDFFSAIYLSIFGKSFGPKAGWFLSVLDRDFLIKRLQEVVK